QQFDLSDAYDELELLGFPLCDPFLLVEERSDDRTIGRSDDDGGSASPFTAHTSHLTPPQILTRQMPEHIGKHVSMLGYVVHVKPTKTLAGERMSFGCFIDPAGDFWDSTQFPSVEARFPIRGRGVYRLFGRVEQEFGHCSLSVERVEKLPWKPDPRYGAK
ncbi:MAG: hypothetical protein KDB88_11790, partial [Flavobacteriales bacterium]|nr:hypothetical protein [Flavobacteriales bacterium]